MDAPRRAWLALTRPQLGWLTLACGLSLTAWGIAAIGTASPSHADKQIQWFGVSAVAFLVALLPHPRWIGRFAWPAFLGCLALLVLLSLGVLPRAVTPVINGARSWYLLGPLQYQPSETTKVFAILAVAWFLRYRASHRTLRGLILPFVITLVPVVLILRQPDLGMALLFIPALIAMLVAAGARLRHLGALAGIAALFAALNVGLILFGPDSAQILRPHQVSRIRSMAALAAGDESGNSDAGFQQSTAMRLAGAGGLTGAGDELSREMLDALKLPEPFNDMIFAVVLNRWGLLGGAGMLTLFAGMVAGCLGVAARSRDPVGRLACVGFAASLATQAFIVTGMTVGLLPITGLTLPFVSYGGSSLLTNFLMLGLVVNFGAAEPQRLARPSFEFDGRQAAFQ